jgi:uncharacterized protein
MQVAAGGIAGMLPPLVELATCSAAAVLALNDLHRVETSSLDQASYQRLLDAAGFASAFGTAPDAFMIAFNEASDHDNDNLRWFRARHHRFYYVDRVIVADHARGRGLAKLLYAALSDRARREGRPLIGCEINHEPPNPASDALHAALGFSEIARRDLPGGKVIRYMSLSLA